MVERRKTLYVSSTYKDLQAHRAALKVALERAKYDVESMERYSAFPEPPLDRCLADVAASDGYVLLVARRYGFRPALEDGRKDRSITELEYEHALLKGKPVFVFCVDLTYEWSQMCVDPDGSDDANCLKALRQRVELSHGRGEFTTPDNLSTQVLAALSSYWAGAARSAYAWPGAWNFSAFIAEKRENFGGRQWLFDEIDAWLAAERPRALLIRAALGVGKSAIMAELTQRNPRDALVAWHFCQHDTPATLRPAEFVRSVAAQLARAFPAYRDLVEADEEVQKRLDNALNDPAGALEAAVLAPLARIEPPGGVRLLLIDALDESLEVEVTSTSSRPDAFVTLLASKASRFPPWLRLLATSRPNRTVTDPLQQAFGMKEIDAERIENQDDLGRYVACRAVREPVAGLLRQARRELSWLVELLVARSEGKFLYAAKALFGLEDGQFGVDELGALSPGMDSFYDAAFRRRFADAGRDYEPAGRLLGVMVAAQEPLSVEMAAEILQTGKKQIDEVRDLLPDFVRLRARRLTFDHFSLTEWLTGEDDEEYPRAGVYAVDVPASRAALRRWALGKVEQGVAHQSPYLLRHLAAHLESDAERQRVVGSLLLEHFEWLQARLDQEGVHALIADVRALAPSEALQVLLAFLRTSMGVLQWSSDQLAVQVAGCIGGGIGSDPLLDGLYWSMQRWLSAPEQRNRAATLLVPMSRSMRLSRALQAILVGHTVEVTALVVLPDGRIASGSWDNTVRLWNAAQPDQPPLVFEGHTRAVNALVVLPDGRIASGSYDGTVRLWNPAQPDQPPLVFEGHTLGVEALVVLPDGRIASGSVDSTVRLWNPAQPAQPSLVFEGHTGAATAMVVLPDGRIASESVDSTVRLWNPARPDQPPLVFEGHTGGVKALVVLPDGRIASGSADNTVRLCDAAHRLPDQVFVGDGPVSCLARTRNGLIVAGCGDGTVHFLRPPADDGIRPEVSNFDEKRQ